jgi:hypothetical protein
MDQQQLFNYVIAVTGALGGWWMKAMWEALKDLQKADKDLTDKVTAIQVLVAGEYATRADFKSLSNAIFTKLDRIEDKLDAKVDKP